MSKLKAFLIMLILVTSMAVFTACSEKIEGTWYLVGEDPDDVCLLYTSPSPRD